MSSVAKVAIACRVRTDVWYSGGMTIIQKLRVFARHHFTDHPHDGPAQDVLLNKIERLGVELDSHYSFVRGLGDRFKTSELCTVSYQGAQYPIYCVDFQPEATGERLYVLVGSHGNEEAGLLAKQEYLTFLGQTEVDLSTVAIRIVTPHNPVGVANFSRFNGQGFDMNRDFIKRGTVETQAVVASFDAFNPTAAISLHEGPQTDGAFFFTNECVTDNLIQPILVELKQSGIQLAQKSYFGNTLVIPGQFPATGVFLWLKKLWQSLFKFQGFGTYCAQQGVPAMVMETSWTTADVGQRVGAQYTALKALTTHLQGGNDNFNWLIGANTIDDDSLRAVAELKRADKRTASIKID